MSFLVSCLWVWLGVFFPCSPLGGPFVYFMYTLGSPRVVFGGLVYFGRVPPSGGFFWPRGFY